MTGFDGSKHFSNKSENIFQRDSKLEAFTLIWQNMWCDVSGIIYCCVNRWFFFYVFVCFLKIGLSERRVRGRGGSSSGGSRDPLQPSLAHSSANDSSRDVPGGSGAPVRRDERCGDVSRPGRRRDGVSAAPVQPHHRVGPGGGEPGGRCSRRGRRCRPTPARRFQYGRQWNAHVSLASEPPASLRLCHDGLWFGSWEDELWPVVQHVLPIWKRHQGTSLSSILLIHTLCYSYIALRPSKPLKSISIAFQNGDIQQKVLLNMRFTLMSKIKNRFFFSTEGFIT